MINNNLSFNSKNEISTGRTVWLERIGLLLAILIVFVPSIWLFQRFMKTEFAQSLIGSRAAEYVVSILPGSNPNDPNLPVGTAGGGSGGNLKVGVSGGAKGFNGSVAGGSATTSTTPALFSSICLQRTGQRVTLNGLQRTEERRAITPNMVINAANAYWDGTNIYGTPMPWPIKYGGQGPGCWYGGRYSGVWDDTNPAVTWSDPYHHSGAMTIRSPAFLVEGFRVNNQGDGIRMEGNAGGFHIRGVYLSNIHDDCIENDVLVSGVVEDSLLDGCYVAFSADDFSFTQNGSANTWQINDNLIYLKRMNTVFKGPAPASGMMFKGWQTNAPGPGLVLKNNIFMADAKAGLNFHNSSATLGLPRNGVLKGCENNIFVWLGVGPFPDKLPSCFRVTTDVNVWNSAVNRWKAAHPNVK